MIMIVPNLETNEQTKERTMTNYIQVNIGQGHLTDEEFDNFQAKVTALLQDNSVRNWESPCVVPVEVHKGTGYWEGVAENSVHLSAYWPGGFWIEALKNDLYWIRVSYEQDSVALIVGSQLV